MSIKTIRVDPMPAVRYAQCWEDADILIEALDIRPGDTCLSISSGGDNSFALLTRNPRRVIAIDTNPAQTACLELRFSAYRNLTHAQLLELLGSTPSDRRPELYRRCRAQLSDNSRRFWDAHSAEIAGGIASAGRLERYFSIFRRRVLPLMHSRRVAEAMLKGGTREEREHFFETVWNSWRWRLAFRIFFSRLIMSRLGRDPSCFEYVNGTIASHLLDRTRHALTALNPADNPYLQWICTGRHPNALPLALRLENFELIRNNLDRLQWHCCSLEQYLERAGPNSMNRFNLSDVFEYLSPRQYSRLLDQLVRAGTPGGRLVYWNMLAPRHRPPCLGARLRPLADLARELHRKDKAFFYSDLVIEEICS